MSRNANGRTYTKGRKQNILYFCTFLNYLKMGVTRRKRLDKYKKLKEKTIFDILKKGNGPSMRTTWTTTCVNIPLKAYLIIFFIFNFIIFILITKSECMRE